MIRIHDTIAPPRRTGLALVLLTVWLLPGIASAADPDLSQTEFFEKRIRPLLIDQCFDCHSADNAESGLKLDSLPGMLRGGLRGPTIVRGKAEESLLIRALRHGELLKMPPKRKLSASEIAVLAQWINDGAVWPGAPDAPDVDPEAHRQQAGDGVVGFSAEQRSFWAFQRPVAAPLPDVQNADWCQSPIDRFILARLESEGLSPSLPAERRTLLRRVTFDLTGLPPTPEDVDRFLLDDSPDAFARVVDRLLASPHYGERWGRHWLDVARYADSNGLDENLSYANAFRYRDYVIRAFNSDKPFNRFVQEQIAGDLLAADDSSPERFDQIIATGFLSIGPKMLAEDDPVKLRMDIIDEQIDTIGRTFLGMTLGCARCHAHKFDPISSQDYYALAGLFHSTQTMDTFSVVAQWHERELATPEAIAARAAHQQQIDAAAARVQQASAEATAELTRIARGHVGDYLLAAELLRRRASLLTSKPPLGDAPDAAARPGVQIIEAEEFARGNVQKDRSTYGSGIGVLVNAGPTPNFAEYDIDVPAAGPYVFEVRYAAAGARPCRLIINGELASTEIADGVTGSWFPDAQKWEIEGFFELNKGRNTVRLEQPTFFPHIDKLLIAPASGAVVPELEPLDAEYRPVPEFVQQWAEYLKQESEIDDALAAFWKQSLRDGTSFSELRRIATALETELSKPAIIPDSESPVPSAVTDSLRRLINADDGPFRATMSLVSSFPEETQKQLSELRDTEKKLRDSLPSYPTAIAVSDGPPEDVRVHFRGSHLTQGAVIPRGFLEIMAFDQQPAVNPAQSGRLEFARWLTSSQQPLTARVFVNRVWRWHFGTGLVSTADNFGRLGERPSHFELLDWLAVRFIESGWSISHLHRLILLSSTWQQAAGSTEETADPENRLLSKMNRRRLEAEAIRDSILRVCDRLDSTMGGSMLPTPNRKYVTSTANVDPVVYVTDRRSVYLPIVRSALYDVFQAFDFADPSTLNGDRQSTTVAPQALFMLNSQLVAQHTESFARSLLADDSLNDVARIRELFRRTLSRAPSPAESARCQQFVAFYAGRIRESSGGDSEQARVSAWQALCRTLIASNEFVYVD